MGSIRFISTTTVQPTFHNELTQRIELTPWDLQLLLLDHIQKGLLFHKPKSSTYEQDPITSLTEHLKHSLSLTLDIFYPLAGRLAITENEDDNTTSFSVDCNGAGAEFVHAVADGVTVADILDSVLVPDDIVYSFFLMNGVLNYEGSGSKPLLAVQITELVDGIFIGCTMNHSVVDGSSFWHFFNTWSEISRRGSTNCGKISQPPPAFGREFLNGMIDLPVRLPNFQNKIPKLRFSAPLLQQRVFHFSKLDGLASNSLLTGSSPRFNVFGNDFGWGRPLAVRSGVGNKFDGKLTVFPGAEDGSIDFESCLLPQTLQALAQDAEFTASLAA